jgi:hypothetical protein
MSALFVCHPERSIRGGVANAKSKDLYSVNALAFPRIPAFY